MTTWLKFLAFTVLWIIGASVYWLLFPVRMVQVEAGALADWAVKGMKGGM